MAIAQSTVFKSNKSQAVRLPKSVALPEGVTKVDIVAQGDIRLITPAGTSWDSWFDADGVSKDFMVERDQLPDQARDQL